jgi:hypothetical protein
MRRFFRHLKLICWAFLSIVFLALGCLAAGLLYNEENDSIAILLFVAALIGAGGCIIFFYCCLRHFSRKPKGPYISTLQ